MAGKRVEFVDDSGHVVTLHFEHWLPRFLMMFTGGVNLCITISAKHILIARTWITRKTLSHEMGHVLRQAIRLGWKYLPWVLGHYGVQGYEKSRPEREADEHMLATYLTYPDIGEVPPWVLRE